MGSLSIAYVFLQERSSHYFEILLVSMELGIVLHEYAILISLLFNCISLVAI